MYNDYLLTQDHFQNPLKFEYIYVSQIGRRFCSASTIIDTHIHLDLFELTIITEGNGIIITNGTPALVEKGDIYLSLPCDSHKIVSDSEHSLKYDFFAFTCENESFKQELERICRDYHSANIRIFHDDRIRPLIGNAIAELSQQHAYSHQLLFSIFQQGIIYIIRGFQKITPKKYSATATHAEILCYQLMNYIDTHIYSLKKLDDLAAITNYSYGYLSAIFKKTTSNTLSDYYHKKKLDAARLLILENKYKIIEIAEMLNYSSVYSFSKAFTKRFGISPRNYKALH